ncbi:MAG: GNAT family N-acetyltransferase [Gammaproteobacteria bacterium]
MMNPAEIRIADWNNNDDRAALRMIRKQVFIDEQQVPVELEWDEFDDSSTHFLATVNHAAVATARLKTDGQLGRMAVLKACRHRGIGASLLKYILAYARMQSLAELYCHAQISALDFYRQHGFNEFGETFLDAGIVHRAMKLKLD